MKSVIIYQSQVQAVLKASKGWKESVSGNEYVYTWPLTEAPHIVIKVYSSVRVGSTALHSSGKSRGKGQDSIKVCAVDTDAKRGYIKSAIVMRVEGWRDNLQKRILTTITEARKRLKRETPAGEILG